MNGIYDTLQISLNNAKTAHARKDDEVEYDALTQLAVGIFNRQKALRPEAAPQDQDRDVR